MSTKLTRHERRRRESFNDSLAAVDKARETLGLEEFTELLLRSSIPSRPDGFPAGTGFDAPRGKSENTSVEAAVAARSPQHWRKGDSDIRSAGDPLVEVLRFVEWSVAEAAHLLVAAQGAIAYTRQVEDDMKERQTSSACLICQVKPAATSGMCTDDYRTWQQHGRPDKTLWRYYKTGQRNSENLVLVTECPPPCRGCRAQVGPHAALDSPA